MGGANEEVDDVNQTHASSQPAGPTPAPASKSNREQARALGEALSTWFAQQTRYRSQSELARALGLPFGTLRGYLMGIRVPGAETSRKLYEVTGLPEFAQAAAQAPSAPARSARSHPAAAAPRGAAPATRATPAQASTGLRSTATPSRPASQAMVPARPPAVQRPAEYPRVPPGSAQPPAPRPENAERPTTQSGRPAASPPAAAQPAGGARSAAPPAPRTPSLPMQALQPAAQNGRIGHPVAPTMRPQDRPAAPSRAEPESRERSPEPATAGERPCADCGRSIPAERLAILPHATRCVQCQAVFERLRRRALAAQQPARRIDWSVLAEQ